MVIILLLAFCGLADTAYLAQHEADGTPLLCNIQNLSGCNIVAQSPYSQIMGVSLAQWGLLFYGILFCIAALELALARREARLVIQGLATFGFFASLYFTALQIFVISALCIYCLASAVLTILIFVAALFLEPIPKIWRRRPPSEPPSFLRMPPAA